MKILTLSVLALLLVAGVPPSSAAHRSVHNISVDFDAEHHLNGCEIDLDDDNIIITHDGRRRETVEITKDYELYINDEYIELDADQQKVVAEYYELGMEIVAYAKKLGWEGARIGVSGAKLGLKAVGGILKLIFTSYDSDDFERDMEREAAKLEARAEVLEEQAEVIEDMIEELDDIAYNMAREIPELDRLGWF